MDINFSSAAVPLKVFRSWEREQMKAKVAKVRYVTYAVD